MASVFERVRCVLPTRVASFKDAVLTSEEQHVFVITARLLLVGHILSYPKSKMILALTALHFGLFVFLHQLTGFLSYPSSLFFFYCCGGWGSYHMLDTAKPHYNNARNSPAGGNSIE